MCAGPLHSHRLRQALRPCDCRRDANTHAGGPRVTLPVYNMAELYAAMHKEGEPERGNFARGARGVIRARWAAHPAHPALRTVSTHRPPASRSSISHFKILFTAKRIRKIESGSCLAEDGKKSFFLSASHQNSWLKTFDTTGPWRKWPQDERSLTRRRHIAQFSAVCVCL